MGDRPGPPDELEVANGAYLQYLETGDDCYIDNLKPDEMRAFIRDLGDADRQRNAARPGRGGRVDEPRLGEREGARLLVAEVWRLVENQRIDARCPAADAALDLRDVIDPNWWPVAEDERAACGVTGSRSPQGQ